MKKPNIAILGASGVVGSEILKILEEKNFEYNSIKFLASKRSAGKTIKFRGADHVIEEACASAFEGMDIVLASAGGSTSKMFAEDIVKAGAILVDNSSAFRMDEDVPLVIAGVNDEDLRTNKGIVANPNCSTSQLMLVLKPLHDYAKIKRLIVSTYQAVSGAGKAAIDELMDNTKANLEGKSFQNECFKYEIGFNVIPQIDVFTDNAYTKEEMKVVNETKKILHLESSTPISCTAVRVPVHTGHSEAVSIEFENEINPQKVREILSNAFGVEIIDDVHNYKFPTPKYAAGKDPVYVGRIREELAFDNGISLWCVADNLRIGAALNTVRIAESLVKMNLI